MVKFLIDECLSVDLVDLARQDFETFSVSPAMSRLFPKCLRVIGLSNGSSRN